jgi:cell division septation protein DedD
MLRIISHIEHLLKVQDCVVLPKLGGFVLQSAPAIFAGEEGLFTPMHKEVVFNTGLQHNDGLLTQQYMDAYGVNFKRACRMVEEDVEGIRDLLFKELKVTLGNVGTLNRGTEGQIVFQTGDTGTFSVDSYGLATFRIKTWTELQQESDASAPVKKNTYYIPINRNILRGVASVAAAIALFFMISTPVKKINPSSYTASFVPSEITNPSLPRKANTLPAATGMTTVSGKTSTDATAARRVTKAPVRQPVYYVIIGSVKTRKQADELALKAGRSGVKSVSRIVVANNIRVYADKFTDRAKAESYLAKIKQTPVYKDAWIYTYNK